MEFLFFFCLIGVLYTYIGYPLLLAFAALVFARPVKKEESVPFVSVLVSAHNEEKTIRERIENLRELDYPREKIEIIVGSDGSTDETYRIIKELSDDKLIRYAVSFNRVGKAAMLAKMGRDARGQIFVFADARQKFAPDTLKKLVACFADEAVGAVSGELMIEDKTTGTGKGMGLYWRYEKLIRRMESALWTTLGATGAVYAIRKEYFRYPPDEILLDDVYIPMQVVTLGKRIVFEPAAKAYDVVSQTTQKEFQRKVRTLLGNFQILSVFSELLSPFKSPVFFQFFSHKFLRLCVPYFLMVMFVLNLILAPSGTFFQMTLGAQFVFYILAYIGYILEKAHVQMQGFLRLLFVPYEFCVLNGAAVAAFMAWRAGVVNGQWEK